MKNLTNKSKKERRGTTMSIIAKDRSKCENNEKEEEEGKRQFKFDVWWYRCLVIQFCYLKFSTCASYIIFNVSNLKLDSIELYSSPLPIIPLYINVLKLIFFSSFLLFLVLLYTSSTLIVEMIEFGSRVQQKWLDETKFIVDDDKKFQN